MKHPKLIWDRTFLHSQIGTQAGGVGDTPLAKVVVVVTAQGITGKNFERGLKASNEGQSTHHMGGATGSFGVRFHIMMSYGLPSPLASYYPSLIPNR